MLSNGSASCGYEGQSVGKDRKHNCSFRIVYTVDTDRMITLVSSLILRKRSEDAQPFKNSSTTSLPPNGLWPTPLHFHLYPNHATSINPFCRTFSLVRVTVMSLKLGKASTLYTSRTRTRNLKSHIKHRPSEPLGQESHPESNTHFGR